jgi:uncharacterized membrane protein YfcA
MDDLSLFAVLCLCALAAGAVNSLAGGGTLLTFPALLVALEPLGAVEASVVANGTSTVALVPGSFAGAWGYRRQLEQTRRWVGLLLGPSLAGGALGALLVTRLDPRYFAALVPWLLLSAGLLFLADTVLRRAPAADVPPRPPTPATALTLVFFQFGVAVYGGYFGAGIGILMISSLALMGLGHMHQINALKNLLAVGINGVSVLVFALEGKVVWQYALPMAGAAVLGGYLGARVAQRLRPRYVRWLVIAIAFGLAVVFFVRQ